MDTGCSSSRAPGIRALSAHGDGSPSAKSPVTILTAPEKIQAAAQHRLLSLLADDDHRLSHRHPRSWPAGPLRPAGDA